jgi:hypothetical protein
MDRRFLGAGARRARQIKNARRRNSFRKSGHLRRTCNAQIINKRDFSLVRSSRRPLLRNQAILSDKR